MQRIGADICEEKIESCHHLNKNFLVGKTEQVMMIKKNLKNLNPTGLDFLEKNDYYKNDSLCPYYRRIWNEFKKLRINIKIFSFFTVNVTVRLRLEQDGPYNSITHLDDLKSLFLKKILQCLLIVF